MSGDVFAKWEEREELDLKRRKERRAQMAGGQVERGKGRAHQRNISKTSIIEPPKSKGKGAAGDPNIDAEDEDGVQGEESGRKGPVELEPLVVLACRHVYHQSCLEAMQPTDESASPDGREFRCPIDG